MPTLTKLSVPPSKSHSMRALLFAAMAKSECAIENLLDSPDIVAMQRALSNLRAPVIDAGNSGQVFRFVAALSALFPGKTTLTGDHSILHRRPIEPLLQALSQLGARVKGLTIEGPIYPGTARLDGRDSQPVSALLMACSFLTGKTELFVDNPGETPWIELTLFWVRKLGGVVHHKEYRHYLIEGGLSYPGFSYTVPGDWSAAAFPIAAALISGVELKLEGLDCEDIQGDRKILDVLRQMGAKIKGTHIYPSELH
ncbi:MAG: 3-phosphoshikimate 1-carboxyvinyltransferase, partial [Chlamydiales bacterium]